MYWIKTFNDFHEIRKSIKIMMYWITIFNSFIKVMEYSIKTFKT